MANRVAHFPAGKWEMANGYWEITRREMENFWENSGLRPNWLEMYQNDQNMTNLAI